MYTKAKIIMSLALFGATTSLMAIYGEHAYLYKDPRTMSMGGTSVAVGGYSTSVFSNPAGLASIEKEEGFVVDILGIGVSASSEVQSFITDISDASNSNDIAEVAGVLTNYAGEHFHIGVDNYSSVSKNSDIFAWSIGILAAADVNLITHANGSVNGGLLETSSRVYGGVVLGAAKPYQTDYGRVDVGVSLKYISQTSYEGALTVSELIDSNDIAEDLKNKYEKTSTGIGLDLGLNYHPFLFSILNPTIGLSVMNIGSMGMSNNYGKQPTTVNIGAAISPEIPYISKFILAVDYVDMFEANKVRIYDYNDVSNAVSFTDYRESDFMKRLRLGMSLELIDTTQFSTTISTGLYQGAYTAGLDMRLTAVNLSITTYQEEIGTGSIDMSDRRYMAKIGIGW